MYDHTFYEPVQISRSDMRPHIKWAVSLVIFHMITSIFLRALCGYIWVNILTLSPRGVPFAKKVMHIGPWWCKTKRKAEPCTTKALHSLLHIVKLLQTWLIETEAFIDSSVIGIL